MHVVKYQINSSELVRGTIKIISLKVAFLFFNRNFYNKCNLDNNRNIKGNLTPCKILRI